jgi:hypothetical protein
MRARGPSTRPSASARPAAAPRTSASAKIMIGTWARYLPVIRPLAATVLKGTGFYVRPAGASLGIVVDTPRLDPKRPASDQSEEIGMALTASARLAAWWNGNGRVLEAWAAALRKH